MFLHRKETERLSNPWWWRIMQVLVFIPIAAIYVPLMAILGATCGFLELKDYFYAWNRCEITSRPRPWFKKIFEPKRRNSK